MDGASVDGRVATSYYDVGQYVEEDTKKCAFRDFA